ncbi:MAG: VOC family protein, partial [Pedobacter sp.]
MNIKITTMRSINPYLNFNGNTEAAFNFYRSVLGGTFTVLQRFKDVPESGKMSEDDGMKIMHITLTAPGIILMATDLLESFGHKLIPGNNYTININASSREEATTLFNGLS